MLKFIAKCGVGCYEKVHQEGHLPYKNSQQLYNASQRLLGKQNILEYSGIRLLESEVAHDFSRYGESYYIEKRRIVLLKENYCRLLFNLKKYGLSPREAGSTKGPFCRRLDKPVLRKD